MIGEGSRKPPLFTVGQVIAPRLDPLKGSMFLLLERKLDTWPTWEKEGKWWQWRVLDLETGIDSWRIETAIGYCKVVD